MNETLKKELDGLDTQGMRRSLRVVEQHEGASLHLHGKPLINFSSNDYLGLSRHPRVIEAVQEVVSHWGAGAGSSRLISGTSVIHHDLEQAIASFMEMPAALVYPTGYMANLGVITTLVGEGDAILLDRLCHASLVDAARLSGARLFVYGHGDVDDAGRALKRMRSYRRRLLVTESLFSMDGDFAPLDALAALSRQHGAISLLDEAHAIGLWGDNGRGLRGDGWDVVMGTLSKSLGSQGGFVCGSEVLIEAMVNRARSFIFTTGLSPACVAAAHAALSLIQEEAQPRLQLQQMARRLRDGLRSLRLNTLNSQSQIVPVLLGSAKNALACAAHLESAGFFAPAIRPPTVPSGECRLRFSVTSQHTGSDIDHLLQALKDWRTHE